MIELNLGECYDRIKSWGNDRIKSWGMYDRIKSWGMYDRIKSWGIYDRIKSWGIYDRIKSWGMYHTSPRFNSIINMYDRIKYLGEDLILS